MERLIAYVAGSSGPIAQPRASRQAVQGSDTTGSAHAVQSSETHSTVQYHEEQQALHYEANPRDAVQRILAGEEIVISHAGTSQYATQGGGISACGIAALNCVKLVFEKEQAGIRGETLLENLMGRDTAEEITSICSRWLSDSHLEVDDIYHVPFFDRWLNRLDSRFASATLEQFQNVLSILQSDRASNTSSAIVITRPPEIITCLKIITDVGPVFVIFDSHARPKHPTGAGFVFNTSLEAVAVHLNQLLAVDSRLLADRDTQWQAHLLGNFSADLFVAHERGEPPDASQVILESSMTVLASKSQLADQQNKLNTSRHENVRLRAERRQLRDELNALRRQTRKENSEWSWVSAAGSYFSWLGTDPAPGPSRQASQPTHNKSDRLESPSNFGHNPFQGNSQPTHNNFHWLESPSIFGHNPFQGNSTSPVQYRAPVLLSEQDPSIALAWKLSRDDEEENNRLLREREELTKFQHKVFDCGICMDKKSYEDVAQIERCKHRFCRDCLRQYITMKLRDRRFPVLCPTCSADKKKEKPGKVNQLLIEAIGIPEEDFIIFEELQLNKYSVQVNCRECKKTFPVDRRQYEESEIIGCPQPLCRYTWCKACHQEVDPNGPKHSCDGTSELNHLMRQQGWKHCPGCKTPVQRISGCNNMTCRAPGCNMIFCYQCGGAKGLTLKRRCTC